MIVAVHLWMSTRWCSALDGLPQLGLETDGITWHMDELDERLATWRDTEPPVQVCAPRPCALQGALLSCGALFACDMEAQRASQSLTDPPAPYGRVGTAPGRRVSVTEAAAGRQNEGKEARGLQRPPGFLGSSHEAVAGNLGLDGVWGFTVATRGPLLVARLSQGGGAPRATCPTKLRRSQVGLH